METLGGETELQRRGGRVTGGAAGAAASASVGGM